MTRCSKAPVPNFPANNHHVSRAGKESTKCESCIHLLAGLFEQRRLDHGIHGPKRTLKRAESRVSRAEGGQGFSGEGKEKGQDISREFER